MQRPVLRGVFCAIVAVTAASLADPLLEAASNAGWFGSGNYTDHSNLDVIPALLSSAALALLYIVLRVRALVASKPLALRRRLYEAIAQPARSQANLFLATLSLQLAMLFGMESIEQIAVAGHTLGGTIWLGAPVPIALAVHAAVCLLTAFVFASRLDATAARIATFVQSAFLSRATAHRRLSLASRAAFVARRRNLLASRSGKRAPPFIFA